MGVNKQKTHARYATVRLGSLLKCSDSMKRSSRFQLMEAGAQGGGGGGEGGGGEGWAFNMGGLLGGGTHVPGTRAGDTCMEKLDTCAMMPLNAELKGRSLCC